MDLISLRAALMGVSAYCELKKQPVLVQVRALLDALPYDTYEAAAAPFEALRDRLTTALELGRWPDEGEKDL